MPYDFTGLTGNQRAVLMLGGWRWSPDASRSEPPSDTLDPLIERGLLVRHYRYAPVGIRREYDVPSDVALAWRAFLAAETPVDPDEPEEAA